MPITSRFTYTADLSRGVNVVPLGHTFFSDDKNAAEFRISVTSGGTATDLTGVSVQAYMLRADHVTVPFSGSAEGNVVSVVLPAACFKVPGRFLLAVKAAVGDTVHTIYAAEGNIMRSSTDTVVDTEGVIPSLEELLAQIAVMEQATENANAAAGTADAAADNANAVAQTVQDKLDSGALTGKGLQILGYYDTAEDLAAGVSAPAAGDAYGVGTADPYDIYVWDALHGVWVNNGPIQGPQGETGPQGPQGEPGTDGRNGADARRNLLDNSCWERPGEIVNQRGESSYTGAVYGIDRWRSWTDTNVVTISADCLSISGEAHLAQYIDPAVFVSGRAYTFAVAKKDGTVRVVSGTCPMTGAVEGNGIRFKVNDSGESNVTISEAGEYVWAALYEGEYTADALPPYIPKGYTAELLECQRYFQLIDGHYPATSIATAKRYYPVIYRAKMRTNPTVTITSATEYKTMNATGATVALDNSYSQMCRFSCTSNISDVTGGLWIAIKAQLSADL